jgi:hypothetical protein
MYGKKQGTFSAPGTSALLAGGAVNFLNGFAS